jgi:hypothetical protein
MIFGDFENRQKGKVAFIQPFAYFYVKECEQTQSRE